MAYTRTLEAKEQLSQRMQGNTFAVGKGVGHHPNHRIPYPKGSKHKPDCGHCKLIREKAAEFGARATRVNVHPELHKPDCRCAVHRTRGVATSIENALASVLLAEFPEVQREVLFGCYRVDAYLPEPYHLAFEADGEHWHKPGNRRDVNRDAWLLRKFGLPVIRLREHELREML